jgi:hypothetical protein
MKEAAERMIEVIGGGIQDLAVLMYVVLQRNPTSRDPQLTHS